MSDETPQPQVQPSEPSLTQSYIALAFVALLVIVGLWVVNSFRASNRAIECFESGHHNCVPLDTSVRGSRR